MIQNRGMGRSSFIFRGYFWHITTLLQNVALPNSLLSKTYPSPHPHIFSHLNCLCLFTFLFLKHEFLFPTSEDFRKWGGVLYSYPFPPLVAYLFSYSLNPSTSRMPPFLQPIQCCLPVKYLCTKVKCHVVRLSLNLT